MDEHHRKIDLQSPSDLTYLLGNIQQVARAKIDLAIPPSAAPDGEDAYRAKVEDLVQTVRLTHVQDLSNAYLRRCPISFPQSWRTCSVLFYSLTVAHSM